MVQLVIWGIVCVAVALSLQKRPTLVLAIVLILRLLIPSQAGWVLIGNWQGYAALHPATLLLIVWAAFALLSNAPGVAREWRAHWAIHSLLALCVTLAVVMAVTLTGPTALFGLTNSLLSSILYFFCLRVVQGSDADAVPIIVRVFVLTMVVESILVIVQWLAGSNLPWAAVAGIQPGSRPVGTFDSPLDLGLAAAIAIPLLVTVRSPLPRYVALVLLLAAVVLSESRTPTIMAVVATIIILVLAIRSLRSLITMVIVVGVGIVAFINLPVLDGLVERFSGDDGSSSAARSVATEYILENIGSVVVFGNGWGSSYAMKGTVLETSLENGYAILAFDLGGLAVIALLAAQLLIWFSRRGMPGAWLAAFFAVLGGFTYSGITTMSAISMVIWAVLAARLSPRPLKAETLHNEQLSTAAMPQDKPPLSPLGKGKF